MPKFIIERDIPGAGRMTPAELQAIAQRSCAVLRAIGPRAQWIESYVADDKVYCVYIADDAEAIKEHAELVRLSSEPDQRNQGDHRSCDRLMGR